MAKRGAHAVCFGGVKIKQNRWWAIGHENLFEKAVM